MNPAAAKSLAGLLLVLAVGAGSAGFILSRDSAPLFQSAAAVRVVRDQTDLEQLPANAPAGLDTAVFLQNEAELIRSDTILQKVIVRLALNQEWGKRFNDGQKLVTSETAGRLKTRVQVSPDPGTALLRIRVTSENAHEAANVADALATAYCEYRVERRQRIAREKIAALTEAAQENDVKVRQTVDRIEQARLKLDPTIRDQNPPPQLINSETEAVLGLRRLHNQAAMVYMVQSNQLARSASLPTEEAQKLETQLTRAYQQLTNSEAALQVEVEKQEALRAYWNARQELAKLNALFAPIKAVIDENQRDLGPLENPPAVIEETAGAAIPLPTHKKSTAQACLVGAGLLLVAAGGLFFLSRKPAAKV